MRAATARAKPSGVGAGDERDDVTVVGADERGLARGGARGDEQCPVTARLLAAQHEQAERLLRVEADRPGQRQPLLARAARADEVADEAVAGRLAGVRGLALEEQDEGRDHTGPLDRPLVRVAQREPADVDGAEPLTGSGDGDGIHPVPLDEASGAEARQGVEGRDGVATGRVELGSGTRRAVPGAVLVDEDGPPAEQLGEGVRDVVDAATTEHE